MKTILIAGQRAEVAKLIELLLQQKDRQFVMARSLAQCRELATRTPPSLIVIDCEMSDTDSCRETVATLKDATETGDTPVFLINAPRDQSDATQLQSLADGVVSEPFNPNEIKAIAQEHL